MRWFEQVLSKTKVVSNAASLPRDAKARNGNPAAAQAALSYHPQRAYTAAAVFILREGREQA